MPLDFWSQTFEIQLVLASGYAAYFASYIGIREHHKPIEILFIVMVYGLATKFCFDFVGELVARPVAASISFVATVLIGIVWRAWGRGVTRKLIRNTGYSWSDDDPSALHSITSSTDCWFTQVAVQTIDGTWLECRDTTSVSEEPNGPFIVGQTGDIALYVTDVTKPNDVKHSNQSSLLDPSWGSRMHYIPANQIMKVTFRLKKKKP